MTDGTIVRASIAAAEANAPCLNSHISADGRYVVFESVASNLVAGDTNGARDVFRKDLQTGELVRVSTSGTNAQGLEGADDFSDDAQFGPNGEVIFRTDATNLIPGDTKANSHILRVDPVTFANREAIVEGRYVETKLAVGAASSVGVAWGDGTSETATPSNGIVTVHHAYATAGAKAAVVTVNEGGQSWAVPYTIDLAATQMTRNTALSDTLSGGAGNDTLTGDMFANVLIGHGGNDTLDGQAGADWMQGGTGNDIYMVDNALDLASETAGNGIDTVQASVNYALAFDIENLIAASTVGIGLSGNALANTILGNIGPDTLRGFSGNDAVTAGLGNDKLYGGLGKDALTGGAGKDVFVFDSAVAKKKNANIDSIVDFNVKDDTIWIDNALSKALGKGTPAKPVLLAKDKFWIGAKSHDASDRVVYNKAKGALYLDEDGSGAKAAILIATLKKGLAMTHKDFFVI